jgi:putative flippase GtrA
MYLMDLWGVPYPVYTLVTYLVGLLSGFPLNFHFTFSGHGEKQGWAMLKYVGTFGFLILVVQGLQFLLIDLGKLPKVFGVGTGMTVYATAGYLLARLWIFAPSKARKSPL